VVKTGKTPVLDGKEWRRLIDTIPADTVRDLRDRALIATLTCGFARIGAALKMRVEDLQSKGSGWLIRLHEKGGKQHMMPCHHALAETLHELGASSRVGAPRVPASAVRGPNHVVKTGKTPVLDGKEWRKLIDAIPTDTVRDLRDRALIAFFTANIRNPRRRRHRGGQEGVSVPHQPRTQRNRTCRSADDPGRRLAHWCAWSRGPALWGDISIFSPASQASGEAGPSTGETARLACGAFSSAASGARRSQISSELLSSGDLSSGFPILYDTTPPLGRTHSVIVMRICPGPPGPFLASSLPWTFLMMLPHAQAGRSSWPGLRPNRPETFQLASGMPCPACGERASPARHHGRNERAGTDLAGEHTSRLAVSLSTGLATAGGSMDRLASASGSGADG
jgi:hypothetical protein